MSRLQNIRQTVQEAAEGITAALGIDTEITDETLTIVAGTGRYMQKIGLEEEEGDLECGLLYAEALRTGKTYIIEEVSSYPAYQPKENELAEICCPILLEGHVIGIISLVAFDELQRKKLLENKDNMLLFLRNMAGLLSSKIKENEIANQMKTILHSIHEGILSVGRDGVIISVNPMAEKLLCKNKGSLEGVEVTSIWPDLPLIQTMRDNKKMVDHEVITINEVDKIYHFMTTISPVTSEPDQINLMDREVTGAVISFRDIAEVKKMIVQMTETGENSSFQELIGRSPHMRELRATGEKISRSCSTVLITGESGTGKGIMARAIHSSSPVKDGPMVTINCGAIPDSLLEVELFGYEGGAFTGAHKSGRVGKIELANGGTLFLDEIGDMPLHLQVKLLHVLQNREFQRVGGTLNLHVNIRVIAATNRNLEEMIKEGSFREDLYFRLNVIPMTIRPLRERREDINDLLEHALQKYNLLTHKELLGFEQPVLDLLLDYDWPGNTRELENMVEYAVTMETEHLIKLDNMPLRLKEWKGRQQLCSLKQQSADTEKKHIEACLKSTGYSLDGKKRAAKLLQISESTLYRRLKELNIDKRGM
jgi:transcriptional regulator with PAS, ATPase and Fis domain